MKRIITLIILLLTCEVKAQVQLISSGDISISNHAAISINGNIIDSGGHIHIAQSGHIWVNGQGVLMGVLSMQDSANLTMDSVHFLPTSELLLHHESSINTTGNLYAAGATDLFENSGIETGGDLVISESDWNLHDSSMIESGENILLEGGSFHTHDHAGIISQQGLIIAISFYNSSLLPAHIGFIRIKPGAHTYLERGALKTYTDQSIIEGELTISNLAQFVSDSGLLIDSGIVLLEDTAKLIVTDSLVLTQGELILQDSSRVVAHAGFFVTGGTVNLQDSSVVDVRRIEVSNGGTLVTAEPSQVLTQQGIYSLHDGIIYLNGNAIGDTMWVDAQGYTYIGTRVHSAINYFQNSGFVTLKSDSLNIHTLTQNAGTLIFQDTTHVFITEGFRIEGGMVQATQQATIQSHDVVQNAGVVSLAQNAALYADSIVSIQAGIWNQQGHASIQTPKIINAATINTTDSVVLIVPEVINAGVFNTQGSLYIDGNVTNLNQCIIYGPYALIHGNLYNDPSATMFWTTGNVSLNPLLQVTDTASIQGTVQVTFINGFNPQPTDSIRLLQAGVLQASLNDTIIPAGYTGYIALLNGAMNLTGLQPVSCESSSENWLTICEDQLPFTWNGVIFTQAGTQTAILINAANCDSLATLHLSTQNCGGSLQMFAYLQGYYLGGFTMQPVLMNSGVYNSYADCDTVWVEWHDTLAPYPLLYSLPATLQTNGSIGVSLPVALLNNWYYVALRNRNHIQTWSAQPIQMQALTAYDFSTGADKSYGLNAIELSPGVWGIYSGDINQDGVVDGLDYNDWELDNNNFAAGYFSSDLNGDGIVDGLDFLLWEVNNNNFVGVVSP